jgi:hypothetical protein
MLIIATFSSLDQDTIGMGSSLKFNEFIIQDAYCI